MTKHTDTSRIADLRFQVSEKMPINHSDLSCLFDRIEALEAENERLRRDRETLLTFARAIQTWRSDADSYDEECEHPQRDYCEDVELMEKAAGYALRRVAERAALGEKQ